MDPTKPPNEGPPLSHYATKCPSNPSTLPFPIPNVFQSISSTKDLPMPQVWRKPLRRASTEQALILTNVMTLAQAILAYMIRSSQMRGFTLISCHCSWLNNMSLRSIQIVQRRTPRRRCHISYICLANFLGILQSSKKVRFRLKLTQLPVVTPTKSMHNECSPSSCSLGLNAIPKVAINRFACVRKAKSTLFRDRSWSVMHSPFVDCSQFVAKWITSMWLSCKSRQGPTYVANKMINTWEIALSRTMLITEYFPNFVL